MPIESLRPIIEKLIIKTQENEIQWSVSYEQVNYVEYRCVSPVTENKRVIYYLESSELTKENLIVFSIKFGPIVGKKEYAVLIEVKAKLEPIIYDLLYLLTEMHNKNLLKYD